MPLHKNIILGSDTHLHVGLDGGRELQKNCVSIVRPELYMVARSMFVMLVIDAYEPKTDARECLVMFVMFVTLSQNCL